MPQVCKNHSEHVAFKRCYRCKSYICTACIHRAHHHQFCGSFCASLFFVRQSFSHLNLRNIIKSGKFDFSERMILYSLMGINLMFLIYLTARLSTLSNELANYRNQTESLASVKDTKYMQERLLSENRIFPATIDSLLKKTTISESISLSGKANNNSVIVLYVNEKLTATEVPEKGSFTFGNVNLNPGQNFLRFRALEHNKTITDFAEMTIEYRIPEISSRMLNVSRGDPAYTAMSLTFDGGSLANNAHEILDILQQKGVTATMFLTGEFIRKNPDVAQRIVSEGHEVGNHMLTHRHLTSYAHNSRHETLPDLTFELFKNELTHTDSLFQEVTGMHMKKFWRAPFGEINQEILVWAASLGYRHISWTHSGSSGMTMDSHDWVSDEESELYKSADEIRDALFQFESTDQNGSNGAIVLMHLGSTRNTENLYESLPDIIDGFRNKGYTLEPVSDLISQ